MKTLNFIPLPIPGESPTSLIRRLALYNGYGNCSKFIEHHMRFKAPKATPLLQGSRFETLLISQVGESLHGRLRQGFYRLVDSRSPGGAFMIGTVRLGRRLLRPKKAALCTECVKEGWERNIKDIYLSTHCPVHNRHYLFACPHCHRQLIWKYQGSLLCVCGKKLVSPACSPEEALPEKRLLDILKTGDQNRLDHLLSIISLLGVRCNNISTKCPPLLFSIAAALVFDDYHRAAKSLSLLIDTSDAFEIDIIIAKLSPIITKNNLDFIKQELMTSAPHKNLESESITIPSKCMTTLLGIGARRWREIRSSPDHCKKQNYSKQEAHKIKVAYEALPQPSESKKRAEQRALITMCYTQDETLSLLRIERQECALLNSQGLLFPLVRVNTRQYFKKSDIDQFRLRYISVKLLAARLNVSNARVRTAIRNTPLVTALENQDGVIFLVKNEDISAIKECLSKLPSVSYRLGTSRAVRICDSPNERLMSLTQAALYLKINSHHVIYYRDLGLIRCAHDNTRKFSARDVENFNIHYATCAKLAKELEISTCRVTQLLDPLKIFPLSGGITNGHPHLVYDRSALPANLKELTNPTHDNFGSYQICGDLHTLNDAAHQLGIKHNDFRKFFTLTIRPARAKQYRQSRRVTPEEIEHVRLLLSSYSKLSTLLTNRGITHAAFSRRFLHPKFVRTFKINDEEYLDSSDSSKLNALLDKYCNPDDIGKILHISTAQAYQLIKSGQLSPVFIPGYQYKQPLFARSEILKLLNQRTLDTRQRYAPYYRLESANMDKHLKSTFPKSLVGITT